MFGRVPTSPLQLIQGDWVGKVELPSDISKAPADYLKKLEENLMSVQHFAGEYSEKAQKKYVHYYNKKGAKAKSF